jgi:hypothetical protein
MWKYFQFLRKGKKRDVGENYIGNKSMRKTNKIRIERPIITFWDIKQ